MTMSKHWIVGEVGRVGSISGSGGSCCEESFGAVTRLVAIGGSVTAKNGFVVEEQKLCFPAGVVKLIVEMELALSGVGK